MIISSCNASKQDSCLVISEEKFFGVISKGDVSFCDGSLCKPPHFSFWNADKEISIGLLHDSLTDDEVIVYESMLRGLASQFKDTITFNNIIKNREFSDITVVMLDTLTKKRIEKIFSDNLGFEYKSFLNNNFCTALIFSNNFNIKSSIIFVPEERKNSIECLAEELFHSTGIIGDPNDEGSIFDSFKLFKHNGDLVYPEKMMEYLNHFYRYREILTDSSLKFSSYGQYRESLMQLSECNGD